MCLLEHERLDEEGFSCIPAREGLAVSMGSERYYLLPDPNAEDLVLDQPELSVRLTREHLEELLHPQRAVALTCFGPEGGVQEKASNQDFALSARIEDSKGRIWDFAAVADGVSTLTFWPERASRIACLVAYQVLRRKILEESFDWERFREFLRSDLAEELRRQLTSDRELLLRRPEVVPSTFSATSYRKNYDNPNLWYNTTLLVSIFGPYGGLLIWAGDGGIWVRKMKSNSQVPEDKEHLRSGDDVELNDFVSLAVSRRDFKGGVIDFRDLDSVSLFLASDGFDRTLSLQGRSYLDFLSDIPGNLSTSFVGLLDGSDARASVEEDNFSLVFLQWHPGVAGITNAKLPNPREISREERPEPKGEYVEGVDREVSERQRAKGQEPEEQPISSPESQCAGSTPVKVSPLPAKTVVSIVIAAVSGLVLGFFVGVCGSSGQAQALSPADSFGDGTLSLNGSAENARTPALEHVRSVSPLLIALSEGGDGQVEGLTSSVFEAVSLRLLGKLLCWAHALEAQGIESGEAFTVVAYVHPKNRTAREEAVATSRQLSLVTRRVAELFAKISQDRYQISSWGAPCLPPAGLEGLLIDGALILGLVAGKAGAGDPCANGSYPVLERTDDPK